MWKKRLLVLSFFPATVAAVLTFPPQPLWALGLCVAALMASILVWIATDGFHKKEPWE